MSTKADRWIPYLLVAPAILILAVFRLWPTVIGLLESLYATSFIQGGERIFVGLDNFTRLFADPVFWQSIRVTLKFNLIINPLQTALALGLALLLNQRVRGINVFRGIFLIPVAISINVSSVIWKLMLDQNGLINGILANFDIARQPFLLSVEQALWSIIMIASWIGVPFWSLFLLAGLQGISEQVYEAAEIDGATKWQQFWKVTLPMMRNSLTFVLIAATVANFLMFVPVLLLTRGGPELSTNVAMYEAYRRGLIYGDLGTSSAMVIILLLIIILVVGGQSYLLREK